MLRSAYIDIFLFGLVSGASQQTPSNLFSMGRLNYYGAVAGKKRFEYELRKGDSNNILELLHMSTNLLEKGI